MITILAQDQQPDNYSLPLVNNHSSIKSTKSHTPPISSCVISGATPNPQQAMMMLIALGYGRKSELTIVLQPPEHIDLNGWPSYTTDINFDLDNFSLRKNEGGLPGNKTHQDGLGFLTYMVRQGWQVHVLPNQHLGGTGKARLTCLRSLYWEIDDKSYSHQWDVIERLTAIGLPPTLTCDSGGKSLHNFLALEPLEPTTTNINRWLRVQRLLVAVTGSDKAIATTNHSLRLPGFNRYGKRAQQVSRYGGKVYTLEQVEQMLLTLLPLGMSEDRWHDYLKHGTDVLQLPESELPSVVERLAAAAKPPRTTTTTIENNDYYEALKQVVATVNATATVNDFGGLGFVPKRGNNGNCVLHKSANKGTSANLSTHNGVLLYGCFKCQEHGLTYTGLAAKLETGKPYWEGKLFVERVEGLARDFGLVLPPKPVAAVVEPVVETAAVAAAVVVEPAAAVVETVAAPVAAAPLKKQRTNVTYIGRFVPEGLVADLPDAAITVLKLPMGSGKTSIAAREYRELADKLGVPFLYISMLTSLSQGASKALTILDAETWLKSPKTRGKHVAACVHSFRESSVLGGELFPYLERVLWETDWDTESDSPKKPIIFIDEVKATLESLFCTDSNLSSDRREVLDQLIKYLPFCKIVVADAQADEFSINLLKQIIQYGSFGEREVTTHWVESTTNVQLEQVYVFPLTNVDLKKTKAGTVLKVLIDTINQYGGMHLLNITGQQTTSRTGANSTKVVQKLLESKGIKTLVVDRDTVSEPGLAADFIRNPTGISHYLKSQGYQVIICSPILKTGVSIEDLNPETPVYQGVWTYAAGLLSPDMVEQVQYRYRNESIPRYLFIPESGFNFIGNKSTKPELIRHKEQANSDRLWDLYRYQLETIDSNSDKVVTHFLLDAYCELAARINREMICYRVEVIERLQKISKNLSYQLLNDEGFNTLATSGKETTAAQKVHYKEVLEVEHQAIVDARNLDHQEYIDLKRENSLSVSDTRAVKKHDIKQDAGTETVVREQVHNHELGFYAKSKQFYRATMGYNLQKTLDAQKLSKTKNRDIVRENKATTKPKADLYNKLLNSGLGEVLRLDKVTNSSPKVIELVSKATGLGWLVERDMVVEVKDYSPVNAVKQSLSAAKQERLATLEQIKTAKAENKELRSDMRTVKLETTKAAQQDYLDAVKQVRKDYLDAVKGVTDQVAIDRLKQQKQQEIDRLRLVKEQEIAAARSMSKEVLETAKIAVLDLKTEKTTTKQVIELERQKLAETRENLTTRFETRKVMVVKGDLADLTDNIVLKSPIEFVSKLAGLLGFKLVELAQERNQESGERVYKIMSGYGDIEGNHTVTPDEINPALMDYYYRKDLVRIVNRLINEGVDQEDREVVTLDNLDQWLESGDTRLTEFIQTLTPQGLQENNFKKTKTQNQ